MGDKAGKDQIPVSHGRVPGHRRGSSPRYQDPGEALNEQGDPLPPHLQKNRGPMTTPHAPHHPRSNRLRPIESGPEQHESVSPNPEKGTPQ